MNSIHNLKLDGPFSLHAGPGQGLSGSWELSWESDSELTSSFTL